MKQTKRKKRVLCNPHWYNKICVITHINVKNTTKIYFTNTRNHVIINTSIKKGQQNMRNDTYICGHHYWISMLRDGVYVVKRDLNEVVYKGTYNACVKWIDKRSGNLNIIAEQRKHKRYTRMINHIIDVIEYTIVIGCIMYLCYHIAESL